MKISEIILESPVVLSRLLPGGPLKLSIHFRERMAERRVSPSMLLHMLLYAVRANGDKISAGPVNKTFILRDPTGFGIKIARTERPDGSFYYTGVTLGPNLYNTENDEEIPMPKVGYTPIKK